MIDIQKLIEHELRSRYEECLMDIGKRMGMAAKNDDTESIESLKLQLDGIKYFYDHHLMNKDVYKDKF